MSDPNELLITTIEAVTRAMAGAFDQIWSKPGAAETMVAFLDGKVRFLVEHDGVSILTEPPPDGAESAPRTGMYL